MVDTRPETIHEFNSLTFSMTANTTFHSCVPLFAVLPEPRAQAEVNKDVDGRI